MSLIYIKYNHAINLENIHYNHMLLVNHSLYIILLNYSHMIISEHKIYIIHLLLSQNLYYSQLLSSLQYQSQTLSLRLYNLQFIMHINVYNMAHMLMVHLFLSLKYSNCIMYFWIYQNHKLIANLMFNVKLIHL